MGKGDLMNILVACETSGVVRDVFGLAGHDATSCDLLPADNPDKGLHLQRDVIDVLKVAGPGRYDLIILHPPCTALAVSGNAHYGTGRPKAAKRAEAVEWTMALWRLCCESADKVAMENPVGVLPIKATQYIQPWQFGHPESKRTGLWLHNLPPLTPTAVLPKPARGYWDNQTPSGQNKLGPSPDRWKLRSRTYPGIADAMAKQWA